MIPRSWVGHLFFTFDLDWAVNYLHFLQHFYPFLCEYILQPYHSVFADIRF